MENAKHQKKIHLEEAQELLLSYENPTPTQEVVSLLEAGNRVAFGDITAKINQPPFDRSPLDGYAVRYEDVENASKDNPIVLSVVQSIYAGDTPKKFLERGQAARVTTGAMMPKGATTVVRQENTDENEETVSIFTSSKKYENYIFCGEDVLKGECVISKGTRLSSIHIGILAGQGIFEIDVFTKPKVGVLSTGSELLDTGDVLREGHIFDANKYMLLDRVHVLGGIPITQDCAKDEPEKLAMQLENLLSQCDFVVTTGGVSVGSHDYMPYVCKKLGGELLFHGIDMKPGGWAMAFLLNNKMVICLSGNPFAAMATFELLVSPFLKKKSGECAPYFSRVYGILRNSFLKESRGRRFVRGRMEGMNIVLPENHAAGSIASMAGCNCLIDISKGAPPLKEESKVSVVLLEKTTVPRISSQKNPKIPPSIAICGVKNSGKTTLLECIIPMLKNRGLKVGIIKHDGHDFSPDVEKTDSFKLRKAGAKIISVFSQTQYMVIHEKSDTSLEEIQSFFTDVDIILVEGGKNLNLPKIEIVREAVSQKNVCDTKDLLALITDTQTALSGIKNVTLSDYNTICNIIIEFWEKEHRRL